jgi:uncharacterized protein YdcH (DUF465 family)
MAAVLIHYFYIESAGSIIFILLALSFIFVYRLFATELTLCISVTIIAFGASLGFKFLASVITSIIWIILLPINPHDFIIFLILFTLHSTFALLFFHIKRFKNGLPFLYKINARSLGIILSVSIFFFYDVVSNTTYSFLVICEALLKLTLFSVLLFFWTKGNLSSLYLERQKTKELEYAYSIINEKDELIHKLQADNDKMAKIIHRDNKLIPSLENAVSTILDEVTDPALKEKSRSLKNELNELIKERSGMIFKSKPTSSSLPKTDLPLIDMMAEYMLHKAEGSGIIFQLEVSQAPLDIVPTHISEKDLCTIFADLIENAMISVRTTEVKSILVQLGLYDGHQTLSVSDSGIPFETKIIYALGKKQKTTYAGKGGSGIGIMSVFEINKRSRASFVLTEYAPEMYTYKKKVSIVFDGRNEYRIHSYRSDVLRKNGSRSDIIFEQLP